MTTLTKPARARARPSLKEFLHNESTGGVVLMVAAIAALVWANSPAGDGYVGFWHRTLTLGWGPAAITEDLQHWVNDGLMALFFFVIGLEIKRELAVGELRDPRAAALPVLAALGGVVVPAAIYVVIIGDGEALNGWGIPMATDIAFAVGVLAILGRHASVGAKLFLLSVAIVDDIIAIVIIAVFYTDRIEWWWLAAAVGGLVVAVALGRSGVGSPWAYVPLGIFVWACTFESGVHATLAGVALGLLTPAGPVRRRQVLEDLQHTLHPVSAFLVVPVFALANAGVDVRGGLLGAAFGQELTWAVIAGLVVGKIVGIAGMTYLARWRRWGTLPADMHPREIIGTAALGGMGFTVSLFITDLALTNSTLISQAKVGILAASLLAALLGTVLLLTAPAGTGAVASRSVPEPAAPDAGVRGDGPEPASEPAEPDQRPRSGGD